MGITVTGQALTVATPRAPNTFQVNVTDDIDVTKMSICVWGEKPGEVWTNNKGGGLVEVSYRIGLVGKYEIRITYDGVPIEGSPWPLTVR